MIAGGRALAASDQSLGPVLTLDVATATGSIVQIVNDVPVTSQVTVALSDSMGPGNTVFPRDTVPSHPHLFFHWLAEPRIAGTHVVGYSINGASTVDSSVHSVSYDVVSTGVRLFTLRAFDDAGGMTEVVRRFCIGHSPDSWFAGPDPSAIPTVPGSGGQRYAQIANWQALPPIPGTLLSCDSLYVLPAQRAQRKTFFEVYDNRLFIRSENDTIDQNSIVILPPGGSDLDSPYDIRVKPNHSDPDTVVCDAEPARVLRPGPANGSPVGFRIRFAHAFDPNAVSISTPSPSALFPVFDDPLSSGQPTVNGYATFARSGRVYLILQAWDGEAEISNGATGVDRRMDDAYSVLLLTDLVDSGGGTPYERLLRQQLVLTFYVNRAPQFRLEDPTFFPRPPEANHGQVDEYSDRMLRLTLPATDPDPYDELNPTSLPGGPTPGGVLRYQVTVSGMNTEGRDTSYTAPATFAQDQAIDLDSVAPYIVGRDLRLLIELCDCAQCEQVPGSGRCITMAIPVRVGIQTAALASLIDATAAEGRVDIRWYVSGTGRWGVERRTDETGWVQIAERSPDGSDQLRYADTDVSPGVRYGYRLSQADGASRSYAGEVWVSVPGGAEFSLTGVHPNPVFGSASLAFALPDDRPAKLEVFDVAGRRIESRQLTVGEGRHVIPFGRGLPPGIHLVRLTHGGRVLSSRVVVMSGG